MVSAEQFGIAEARHYSGRGRRKQLHQSRNLSGGTIQSPGERSPLVRREHEPRTVSQNPLGALAPAFHEELGQRLVAHGSRGSKQLIVARRDSEMHAMDLGL
jgi:hypothetical protein